MWNSITVTIAAGTPQRIANVPTEANRLIFTPLIGATPGVVYVLNQDTAVAMTAKNAQNLVTEIGPASSTIPGTPFRLERLAGQPPINVQEYGIDGAHTGDTVQAAWEI
jgi:hypothetical protein